MNLFKTIRTGLLAAIASFVLLANTAFALNLDEAKTGKLVAESATGYLVPTPKSTPDALVLIKDINDKRKQKYTEIATKQNTALENIEKIAGEKILNKLPAGSVFQNANGEWDKK